MAGVIRVITVGSMIWMPGATAASIPAAMMPGSAARILERTAVGTDRPTGTEQREGACHGLGHQQASKGIAVVKRQLL
jgi:hypothetical protein